jgi:hypothetical protein
MSRSASLSRPSFRVIAGTETVQSTIRITRRAGPWGVLRNMFFDRKEVCTIHSYPLFHSTCTIFAWVVVVELIGASNAGSFLLHFHWQFGWETIGTMGPYLWLEPPGLISVCLPDLCLSISVKSQPKKKFHAVTSMMLCHAHHDDTPTVGPSASQASRARARHPSTTASAYAQPMGGYVL